MKELRSLLSELEHFATVDAEIIEHARSKGKAIKVITLNPEILAFALRFDDYRKLLLQADMYTVDGIGAYMALGCLTGRWVTRFTGVQFTDDVLSRNELDRPRIVPLIVGPSDEVAETLKRNYPASGFILGWNGNYQEKNNESIAEQVAGSLPNAGIPIVLVGLGVPKQDFLISRIMDFSPNVSVLMGVGGAVDVLAGKQWAGPYWARRVGLEWLFRIARNPTRIKRLFRTIYWIFRYG